MPVPLNRTREEAKEEGHVSREKTSTFARAGAAEGVERRKERPDELEGAGHEDCSAQRLLKGPDVHHLRVCCFSGPRDEPGSATLRETERVFLEKKLKSHPVRDQTAGRLRPGQRTPTTSHNRKNTMSAGRKCCPPISMW